MQLYFSLLSLNALLCSALSQRFQTLPEEICLSIGSISQTGGRKAETGEGWCHSPRQALPLVCALL